MQHNISAQDRYLIKWVGRCKYDNHDKIWGWFFYFQQGYSSVNDKQPICYTFWSRTGKTPSFKKHEYNKWVLQRYINKKKDNSYANITVKELEMIWPSIYKDLENRFVFHILADNI